MSRLWIIIAYVCIVAAALMALLGKLNAAFVIAALGVVSWFLNYRLQLKKVIAAADAEESNSGEDTNEN